MDGRSHSRGEQLLLDNYMYESTKNEAPSSAQEAASSHKSASRIRATPLTRRGTRWLPSYVRPAFEERDASWTIIALLEMPFRLMPGSFWSNVTQGGCGFRAKAVRIGESGIGLRSRVAKRKSRLKRGARWPRRAEPRLHSTF